MVGAEVLVASNRGPLSHRLVDGRLEVSRGGGGLVSALSSLAGDPAARWLCAAMSDADRAAVSRSGDLFDAGGLAVRMLDLDAATTSAAYDGIANSTLWFLHHQLFNLPTEPVFDAAFGARWQAYVDYNHAFVDALAEDADPGATVLVQDYHLCLVPSLLRERRPDLAIGHFSHTPWAPPAAFRVLPETVARQLLLGVLGADRAGFLSPRWADAFGQCCADTLGARYEGGVVTHAGHATSLAVHALGVDGAALTARAAESDVTERRPEVAFPGMQVIARVDRAELSKNIVRGLLAYRELLETRPDLRGRVVHATVAYPSRGGVPAYRMYMEEVERVAAAINADFGTGGWDPVALFRDDDYALSLALLGRADVLLINPVRDGMNLVAKEGPILSGRDAVLVLSTEAGAADELGMAALLVQPFDVSATAAALAEALAMPAAERAHRAGQLRTAATRLPPQQWFREQAAALRRQAAGA